MEVVGVARLPSGGEEDVEAFEPAEGGCDFGLGGPPRDRGEFAHGEVRTSEICKAAGDGAPSFGVLGLEEDAEVGTG